MSDWTLHLGDCLDPVTGLASLADKSVDHVICDPPYSENVHGAQRRGHIESEPGTGRSSFNRSVDLGFESLSAGVRSDVAIHCGRIARRWAMAFCDVESAHLWSADLVMSDLDYVRTMAWIKIGSTPQFTGDRPAVGFEAIVLAHQPGKKRWNGGGKHGVYSMPIVLDRGHAVERVHTTQKPDRLMEMLIRDFTDPGETILDPFAGSGTTGVAAIRMGRKFIGWERDPKYHAIAMKRLAAAREQLELCP